MSSIRIYTDAHVVVPDAHVKGRAGFGYASCGIVLIDDQSNQVLATAKQYLGEITVPSAELEGIKLGLKEAIGYSTGPVIIFSDSKLAINWLNGQFRQRVERIRELVDSIRALESRYVNGGVVYNHIPRKNKWTDMADQLAKQAYSEVMGVEK